MNGTVLNIQRFCTSDGPGIRTTVFLKGCPLRCPWCHNPESQERRHELLYDREKCVSCLSCVPLCPVGCHTEQNGIHVYDRTHCIACGKCLSPLCTALEQSGREMTAEEVLAEVLKDRVFYDNSGGGLTLSGGEPLAQAEFCTDLLRRAGDHGIHTALETCGYAPTETFLRIAAHVDLFLFDCKETDPARHKALTGVDNALILQNLCAADALGKETVLRCPIIPGVNDRAEHLRAVAALANGLRHIKAIEIEPYHTFGAPKYVRLGRTYALPDTDAPSDGTVNKWIAEIQKSTALRVVRA